MRADRRWAAVTGLAAVAMGLAVSQLITLVIAPNANPVTAVGSWMIDLAPPGVKNAVVDAFGTGDKPFLVTVVLVMLAVFGVLGGLIEYRRKYLSLPGIAVIALLAVIAASTRSNASTLAPLPAVLGAAAAAATLVRGVDRLRSWESIAARTAARRADLAPDETLGLGDPVRPARRQFLTYLVTTSAVAVVIGGGARVFSAVANASTAVAAKIKLPKPATASPAIPADAELGIRNLSSYVTPNADFYRIDTALIVPSVNPDTWKLRINGMVEHPIEVTLAELLDLPLEEHVATLACVSNEVGGNLIGNATWLGYPIRNLLARAKPKASADMVLSRSVDGFTAGTPLTALTDPNRAALLAVGMNGHQLPPEHGFPVRMVVPGLYGYVSATKWVTELTVSTFARSQGYWVPRGWSVLAPVKLASRIDTPSAGVQVKAGKVAVAGVAWRQHTGISGVQVRVDKGDWQDARLAGTVGTDTWRQWVYEWPATKGHHTLSVRAIDTDGVVQTAALADPIPNGATGYHEVSVTVA